MPRSGEPTRRRILDAAYAQFYRDGFARVTLDDIATRAKVTKRTLYYHFDSKDALLGAVLDRQHELALAHARGLIPDGTRGPGDALARLFADLAAWTQTPRWQGSGFTRLAMELAGLPGHPARKAARRHKATVEAAIAERLARSGANDAASLARLAVILIEGAAALTLIHGGTAYVTAAAEAAQRLASSRPTPRARRAASFRRES